MLIRNELDYLLKQPVVWLCITLPMLFVWGLTSGGGTFSDDLTVQLQLNLIGAMMCTLPMLIAVISPISFLRDKHANMQELIDVTKFSAQTRHLMRFISLYGVSVLICIGMYCVVISSSFLTLGMSASLVVLIIKNLFLLVLPNVLLLCAIAFWVCQITRYATVNFVVFIVLWIGYLVLTSLVGNPILAGSQIINHDFYSLFVWIDPFAFTAVIDGFSHSSLHITFALLLNRVVIVLCAVGLIYFAVNRQHRAANTTLKKAAITGSDKEQKTVLRSRHYRPYKLSPHSFYRVLMSHFGQAFIHLISDKITIALLLIWPALVFNTVMSSSGYAEVFATIAYTSMDAINHFAFDMLPLVGCLLVSLWSWQLCTRDKHTHMSELIAAFPIKNSYMLLSHLLVMLIMTSLILILSFFAASTAQLVTGSDYHIMAYVYTLLLQGLSILLFAWIAMCVMHLCKNEKLSALIIAILLCVKFTPISTYLYLTHTFWNIAAAPLQAPELFWGYRSSITTYWPYMSAWCLGVVSLCCITVVLSHRGAGYGLSQWQHKHNWIALPVLLSGSVFFNLHSQLVAEKTLTNSHKREEFKAQYEQQFAKWKEIPQPVVTHIDAKVDFFTDKKMANFKLNYTLENHTEHSIEQILVGRAGFYDWAKTHVVDAQQLSFSEQLKHAIFAFDTPMQPGETRTLHTEFTFKQAVNWPVRGHQFVTPELSYIRGVPLLPSVGYQTDFELQNNDLREQHNLDKHPNRLPSRVFADKTAHVGRYDWLTMRSTITTDKGQYALSQGQLLTSRSVDNRSEFVYETQGAMRARPTWLSMPFSPITEQHRGVTLQVFAKDSTDKQRQAAIQIHLKAMQDTISWFTNNISPYLSKQMSIVGVPSIGSTGFALPQVMLINDSLGFRAKPTNDAYFDQRYRRAVHETAHQWFGHDIGNGVAFDSAFLIESMAKYVEIVMLETHYGRKAMQSLIDYERQRYQNAVKTQFTEPRSLVDAIHSHDQYSRATLVFAQLRDTFGDKPIIEALRQVWTEHRYPNKPASSMDFVRALKASAGNEHSALIESLLLEPDNFE